VIGKAKLEAQQVDETSADVPEGAVIRTEPIAGTTVAPGDQVTVYVSKGVEKSALPTLANLTVPEVTTSLEESGLKLGSITRRNDPNLAADVVISGSVNGVSVAAGDEIPKGIEIPVARPARTGWFQTGRQAANEPSHFEPAAEYLEELIEEDRRRARRRRVWWFVGFIAIVAVIAAGVFAGYAWTQSRYFVGADDDSVVIYRGIQQDIGPISLSTPFEDTDILLADLPAYQRQSVEQTISARSLADAQAIVDNLRQGTP